MRKTDQQDKVSIHTLIKINQNLSYIDIYYQVKDVDKVYFWQSTFNFVCMIAVFVLFCLFGLLNWVFMAYKLMCNPRSNKFINWFEKTTNYLTTSFSVIKILFVFI